MPKQRHHQHHRQRGVARGGLRLPTVSGLPFLGAPNVQYPKGWTPRPLNLSPLFRLFAVLALGILALAAIAFLALTLFGGR